MRRAIAFTRVSTQRQDEGERQLVQIRKYCKEKGYRLIEEETITEIISGISDDREGLYKLKGLTREIADLVIVSEASRLTRKDEDDYLDLLNIVRSIQKTGLDLFILGSGQEYSANKKLSLIDVITLVIESDRNSQDRTRLLQKLKSGKDKILEKNGFIGHRMSYGYRVNKTDKGYFEIVEEEAEVVRLMFKMVGEQGYSVKKCSDIINRTKNVRWSPATVLKMLKNPTYIGKFKIADTILNVPAIIDNELFDIIPIKTSSNHIFTSNGSKHFNALKGIFKCACGCSYYLHKSSRVKGKYYFHYCCYSKKGSNLKTPCNNKGIEANFINSIVWNITKTYINIDDFKDKTDQQKKSIELEIKELDERVLELKKKALKIEENIESLTNTIENTKEDIVIPILTKRLSKHIIEVDDIKKEADKASKEAVRQTLKLKDLAASLLPSLMNNITIEEKSEILQKYIERITYFSITQNRGFIVILFKNGMETIVAAKSQPIQEAIRLPFEAKINIDSRTVTGTIFKPYQEKDDKEIKIKAIYPNYTHQEIFKRYNLPELKIDLT